MASLSYSTTPVLSLAHVELPLRECHLVFSGATNGAVAVWDCTQQADDIAEQQPLLALPGVHQSGINAMSAACTQCFSGAVTFATQEHFTEIITHDPFLDFCRRRSLSYCVLLCRNAISIVGM